MSFDSILVLIFFIIIEAGLAAYYYFRFKKISGMKSAEAVILETKRSFDRGGRIADVEYEIDGEKYVETIASDFRFRRGKKITLYIDYDPHYPVVKPPILLPVAFGVFVLAYAIFLII